MRQMENYGGNIMATKEEISLSATCGNGTYDACAKENMHHPKLIAPILKEVVPEFRDCTIEEVIQCIVSDSICDDPVDNVSAMANTMETEMSSVSEKLIRYDARFKAINPKLSSEEITFFLHIDLEVQNTYKPSNPKYPIIKRGIYYGAREISSQLGILTDTTNYNDLEKVYSIWICNEDVPLELQNTVSLYKIDKHDLIGNTSEPKENYDLLNVIMIRRGEQESDEAIFDYLTSFFNSNIDGICKYVNIKDDEEVLEGVRKMSGLGQTIYEEGLEEGIEKGIEKTLRLLIASGKISQSDAEEISKATKKDSSLLTNED